MNLDGAMSGLMVFPARAAHRVPAGIAIEDAVFAEPAAVALRAVLRADRRRGESILVVGAGTIGWLIAAIAMDLHDIEVAVAEPQQDRLARVTAIGARAALPGEQFDVVIEASGHPAGFDHGFSSLAPSGRLVVVGLTGARGHEIDVDRLVVSDQTIVGSLGSPGIWERMLETLGRGRVHPAALVTGRYDLKDAVAGYASLKARAPGTGKLLILPQAEDRI
jgi:threonine dehydrogenase-like Zn-dependent dehydrogenase